MEEASKECTKAVGQLRKLGAKKASLQQKVYKLQNQLKEAQAELHSTETDWDEQNIKHQ